MSSNDGAAHYSVTNSGELCVDFMPHFMNERAVPPKQDMTATNFKLLGICLLRSHRPCPPMSPPVRLLSLTRQPQACSSPATRTTWALHWVCKHIPNVKSVHHLDCRKRLSNTNNNYGDSFSFLIWKCIYTFNNLSDFNFLDFKIWTFSDFLNPKDSEANQTNHHHHHHLLLERSLTKDESSVFDWENRSLATWSYRKELWTMEE